MTDTVTIVPCADYTSTQLQPALAAALAPFGGMKAFVKPGQRVLLKCNLVLRRRPEGATTTHPAVIAAVVKEVQAAGGVPVLGDSPGGPFNSTLLRGVYDTCGLSDVAAETGCELNWDFSHEEIHYPTGKYLQRVPIIRAATQADVVINLPKLKTHGLTLLTAGVKNMFGLVPGLTKVEYHMRLPNRDDFSAFLVELCHSMMPALTITDAIIGMEGDGPSGGNPVVLGALLASTSPFAHDVVAAAMLGMKSLDVTTIRAAAQLGIFSDGLDDINVIGPLAELTKQVVLPETAPRVDFVSRVLPPAWAEKVVRALSPKPEFLAHICSGCGVCIQSCPPRALQGPEYPPKLNLDQCIRCFCCQELCPIRAIKIKRSPLSRLLFGQGR